MLNHLFNLNRHYYTQSLKCNGKDLFLQTDWFNCPGIKETIDNKKEILVTLTPEVCQVLKNIEAQAKCNGVKLPMEYQSVANTDFFKPLPERTNFFMKLKYDTICFDQQGAPLKFEQLGIGDYRAVIHVKGLYIGHHPSGKTVSLQLRIAQLQYIARTPTCMFGSVPSFTLAPPPPSFNSKTVMSEQVPINVQQNVQPAAKKGRKPTKLQRQNAFNEMKIQQEEHRNMESIPAEFFREAMMDVTNLPPPSSSSSLASA